MRAEKLRAHIVEGLQAGVEARAAGGDLWRSTSTSRSANPQSGIGPEQTIAVGNGGSAGDAQHWATEFVCRFVRSREALPAMALTTASSVLTAIGNDFGFEQVFARQIRALARPGDVAKGISTSGRSANVLEGIKAAREMGLTTIALTGGSGGELAGLSDIALIVPSNRRATIQECHIALLHAMCEAVEGLLFGDSAPEPEE